MFDLSGPVNNFGMVFGSAARSTVTQLLKSSIFKLLKFGEPRPTVLQIDPKSQLRLDNKDIRTLEEHAQTERLGDHISSPTQ